MLKSTKSSNEKAIIAYIAPMGSRLTEVDEALDKIFRKYKVNVSKISLSEHFESWLKTFATDENADIINGLRDKKLFENLKAKIEAGDKICNQEKNNSALIELLLEDPSNNDFNAFMNDAAKKSRVLLLRQLKRVEELSTLRKKFGDGVFLLGLYSSKESRKKHLIKMGLSEVHASELIERDEGNFEEEDQQKKSGDALKNVKEAKQDSKNKHGQEMGKLFSHADVFIDLSGGKKQYTKSLDRLVQLLLGNPFIVPDREEHAMFMAFAASLQSMDLCRQVGAVITDPSFDILATGYNEVPSPGGGHYHNQSERDGRDFYYNAYDSNQCYLMDVVSEIFSSLGCEADELKENARKWLLENKKNKINSTLDFGRPVHAEMSALMTCARKGISSKGSYLFVTTFPCQNCAKHIVAAGIKRVYFIEPYPKSLAMDLHEDALFLNDQLRTASFQEVELRPYVGIGPRRFFDLFALNSGNGVILNRKNSKTGIAYSWPEDSNKIRSDKVEKDGNKVEIGFPRVRIPQQKNGLTRKSSSASIVSIIASIIEFFKKNI
ncbi:MAG: hypothetical protein H7A32_05150 [Deltaproteobacteria bacterium]|nr:hypothetical protein [Deltaproteobacteria bacterium]